MIGKISRAWEIGEKAETIWKGEPQELNFCVKWQVEDCLKR